MYAHTPLGYPSVGCKAQTLSSAASPGNVKKLFCLHYLPSQQRYTQFRNILNLVSDFCHFCKNNDIFGFRLLEPVWNLLGTWDVAGASLGMSQASLRILWPLRGPRGPLHHLLDVCCSSTIGTLDKTPNRKSNSRTSKIQSLESCPGFQPT